METDNRSTAANPVGRFMVAGGAVIEYRSAGKILVLRRGPDLDWHPHEWEIPYGRIDQFETVEDGLRREIREEAGIGTVEIVAPMTVWHIFRGLEKVPENELIGITFLCRTETENVSLSGEHDEYRWVAPEEALELVMVDGIRRDIRKYIEIISQSGT